MSGAGALRLGTRRSALALAQSQDVAEAIEAATGRAVELVPITSEGDTTRASLASLGGTGVFATRLREALRAGECDLLVHSLKDLPTAQPDDLVLAALPARADARDVVVTRGTGLQELAPGASVGTGSPRRIAQVRSRAPHVETHDLRGNIDSRLGRVRSGELDAVVLAAAGIGRLEPDLEGLALDAMGQAEWPSAAGQGILAVEIAADASDDIRDAVAPLDDADTRLAATLERGVLAELEAGCHAPVGIHAATDGDGVRVRAIVYATDGGRRIGIDRTEPLPAGYAREAGEGPAGVADGAALLAWSQTTSAAIARRLLQRGAATLVHGSAR